MGYYFMDYWYIVLVLPAIIFSIIAQIKVNSAYNRYKKILSRSGLTGADAARRVMELNGVQGVRIEHVHGKLSDHYDPRTDIIRLSDDVYAGNSVAALGIAAHEAGHACQHHLGYSAIRVRNAILPVANIGSAAAIPLVLIGFIFNFGILINLGIIFFAGVVVFQLVTLPVEINASTRAKQALANSGMLSEEELGGAKKVLHAAAMTYVAALAVSLMQLVRLLLLARNRD